MGLLDAPTRLPVPNLIRPSGLRRWRKFRAEAIYDRQVISCYGDSHTEGRYADTATTIPITTDAAQELWRDQGWVAPTAPER